MLTRHVSFAASTVLLEENLTSVGTTSAAGDMTSLFEYDVSTTRNSNITDAPTADVSDNMTNGPAANGSDVEQPVGPSIPDGRKCTIGLYCFVCVYVGARFYSFEGVE